MSLKKTRQKNNTAKHIKVYHRYFNGSGFYKFVFNLILKLFLIIAAIVGVFFLLKLLNIDIKTLFIDFVTNVPDYLVWLVFFVSESFLGLIPPDLFIVWGEKFKNPFLITTFLALLSYIGGFVSYCIGAVLMRNKKINHYIRGRYENIIVFLQRWGGFFVLIAALLPFPYSIATLLSGMVKYRIGRLALFGLARLARFYIYAAVLFEVV